MRPVIRSALLAAAGTAALVSPAMAQDATIPESEIDQVIVTAAPYGVSERAAIIATDVIDEEALAQGPAATLGDMLNGRPGVRSTNFAPGASRPVIRGLSGPRVQVLTNGIGLIDASSVSPDHAVAADPSESNRIEILRGPSALMYGGSAIGGVVNVMDGRIPNERPTGRFDGRVTAQASSVDDGLSGAARISAGFGPLVLTADVSRRETEDYDIPSPAISQRLADAEGIARTETGTQANSWSELSNWGIGAGWVEESGDFVGASFKSTDSRYGVVAEDGVFIELSQERYDVRGEHSFDSGPIQTLRASIGKADYTHTEFEGPGEPGTIFVSDGWETRLDLVQVARGGWNGAVGVQVLSKDFQAIGDEAFVPSTETDEFGLFAVQRFDADIWGVEGGLRFDRRAVSGVAFGDSTATRLDYDNWSASASAFLRPVKPLFLGLSLTRNARAPSDTELFADGLHIATSAYERGDRTLAPEIVTTIEGTAHYDQGAFTGDIHIYRSEFDGFIDEVNTGLVFVDDETLETFPIFQFTQTDATFTGVEAEGEVEVWRSGERAVSLSLGGDMVRAESDLGNVARIAPWSLTAGAEWTSTMLDASLSVRRVGRQDRVADYELPTDGYTMVDASLAWRPLADRAVTVFVQGKNLTDEEAREHASFLKDIAPLPGRNVRVGVTYAF